jgi:hypothetical protein
MFLNSKADTEIGGSQLGDGLRQQRAIMEAA